MVCKSGVSRLVSIRTRAFADAASANEDLRLQKQLALARFAGSKSDAASDIVAEVSSRIEGLHEWLRMCGKWVVEEKLLRPGTHRRDWKQTQTSDGHVVVRHPEWDEALRMCFAAATDIKMYAQ